MTLFLHEILTHFIAFIEVLLILFQSCELQIAVSQAAIQCQQY